MADTYFDYVLSQCRTQAISSICEVASTCNALAKMADSGFYRCRNIKADWRLFETVKDCLNNTEIIDPDALGHDALEVYNKCRFVAFSDESINYDRCFDMLVDLNWLQASIRNAKIESLRYTELLSDPIRIRSSLKEYLFDVYNNAVQDSEACDYIEKEINAKGKLFKRSELMKKWQDRMINSHKGMALFFGLTATAALAESIRRGIS